MLLLGLAACSVGTAALTSPPSGGPTASATPGWSLEIRTSPEQLTPGRAAALRLTLRRDGVIQKAFASEGGTPLHLSVVSQDLQEIQDLHPVLDPATGEFTSPVTVARARPYVLFADVTLRDQTRTTVRGHLTIGSADMRASSNLQVDDGPQQVGRYTVTPEVASPLIAGVDLVLIASITRQGSSGSITFAIDRGDAHVVILREDTLSPVPSWAVVRGGHGGMLSLEPNQIAFATKIPGPGRYVIFTEFPADGRTVSARNVYDVIAPPDGAAVEPLDPMTHEMGDGSTMSGAMQSVPIEAFQWGFEPSTIRVTKGSHVKISLTSRDVPHGFSLLEYDVSETILPGQTSTASFVADKRGTFSFGCDIACGDGHQEMRGVLIVE